MMIRTAALFVCLALSFIPAARAQDAAAPPIGIIIDSNGAGNLAVRAADTGEPSPVRAGDQVYTDDILQTGPEDSARIVVVLIDGSRFTLGAGAQFKIDSYAYDDTDDTANMARYSISKGAFLYTSGLMTKKRNPDVKIAIPYGSIGIHGTSLWGGQLGDQYGVYVDDGTAALESRRGVIFITAGHGTSLRGLNAIPDRPHTLSPEVLSAIKATVSLQHAGKIKTRMDEAAKKFPAMIALHKAYVQKTRLEQLGKSSYRRQSRGILKIEQDRQDKRMRMLGQDTPAVDGADDITKPVAPPGSVTVTQPQTPPPPTQAVAPNPLPAKIQNPL